MEKIRRFIETYSFGVCNYIGNKVGIQTSRVRVYFIYASFVTFGSPVVLYLVLAFWLNIKKYIRNSWNAIIE